MLDTPFAFGRRQRASSSTQRIKRGQSEQLSSSTRKQDHRRSLKNFTRAPMMFSWTVLAHHGWHVTVLAAICEN